MTSDNEVVVSIAIDIEPGLIDKERIKKLVWLILEGENVSWSTVGIIFAAHNLIHKLNRTYLDHDFETDVLSFVIDRADDCLEGEVYVDVETASERHDEFGATHSDELERYVAHGVLHLSGYDDSTEERRAQMHTLENSYLALLS